MLKLLLAAAALMTAAATAHSQTLAETIPLPHGVKCWLVPNGVNTTIQCANGYWYTTTPEGETFTGNGNSDPSASAQGSGIVINPGTGGVAVGLGPMVTPPTQVLPMLEPYQAQQYGFMPRQD